MAGRRSRFLAACFVAGCAFLHLPILWVILHSFNESRLVTVWAGFSLRWWRELPRNEAMLDAAWLSVQIAAVNACVAAILGTMLAFALVRGGRFRGRSLLEAMAAAPLAMPEIVLGASLLLLFVAAERVLGWPARGFSTVAAAHITLSLAYVAVVVRARLLDVDRSLEEAAQDLGAKPAAVFFSVTLPLIAPAVLAGWLLAFTLSLDDLVLTQFVAGPATQTLPMQIYASVRLGVSPQVNVLATVLILAVAAALAVSGLALRRRGGGSRRR